MNLFKIITVKDEIVIGLTPTNSASSAAKTPAPSRRRSSPWAK